MAKKTKRASGEALHELFRAVFALHSALSGIMDDVHLQAGMRTPQVTVAGLLKRGGPATVPHLAADLGVSRQYVQTVCNELHADGLVEFKDNPRHRRSRLVLLTEKGARVLAAAKKKEAGIILSAMPDLDAESVSGACELLRKILGKMDGDADGETVGGGAHVSSPRNQGDSIPKSGK